MDTINPCHCGGLPYISPYYAPDDVYKIDEMYVVRCQLCGHLESIEYTKDKAVEIWNQHNNYKINEKQMLDKIFAAETNKKLKKIFGDSYESEESIRGY